MPEIELLDQQTIDKIAAGEVVDRPASVIKELVENAIDAGSSAVTIEIKDGGIVMIRVTDNGCGIERNQIPKAFYRHATSKIRSVTDLLSIHSLGFRGEALSSIAAVSQVEMITKPNDQMIGCRYRIEGGKEIGLEEIGAPNGTTIIVRNLFYNTPARRKFLKTARTEAGYVDNLVEKLAMSHPDVAFQFIQNGQIRLHTSGNGELKDVIYQIYGREIAANLLPVHETENRYTVHGYIGKPLIARGNRTYENYFINGRYIHSKLLAGAIEDGYRGFLMQHKFPLTVLNFSVDDGLIDVNVHPSKMEIRFSHQNEIYESLSNLIHKVLSGETLIPEISSDSEQKHEEHLKKHAAGRVPEPFEEKRLEKIRASVHADSPYERKYPQQTAKPFAPASTGIDPDVLHKSSVHDHSAVQQHASSAGQKQLESEDETIRLAEHKTRYNADHLEPFSKKPQQTAESVSAHAGRAEDHAENANQSADNNQQMSLADVITDPSGPTYRLIGQAFDTYWMIESNGQLYIIDQHAAHEKVLYERTMKAFQNKSFSSQMCSPPMILNLNMQEENLMERYHSYFEDLGFEIEPFGEGAWAIRAVPADLYDLNTRDLFLSLIDDLTQLQERDAPDMIREKIASMSCKAAVKGQHRMSVREAQSLLDELMTLENPYFCPHGRPVMISVSRRELDKKFKRIL